MPISITSKPQALALVGEWVREWRRGLGIEAGKSSLQTPARFPKLIFTPNPEIIVAAQSDPALMKTLQSADLSIPDGVGVVWTLGLPSRLSGLDLMEGMILQGYSVLLLGGRPGVAQAAAKKLMKQGLGLEAGFPLPASKPNLFALSGPQNISAISKSENDRLIAQINSFSPDLLFVAFGHPKQEKWLTENRERLTAGVAMGVGGAFDQIADPSLRPPPYINSIGLGWLYRLIRQPWRWKRQLALITFIYMVAKERFVNVRGIS